ncbi:MAG: hypothetical protein R3F59_37970 [Myxococcota bacterium]
MDRLVGPPGLMLSIVGLLNAAYAAVYGLWTLMPLAFTLSFVASRAAEVTPEDLFWLLVVATAIPLLQLLGFAACLFASGVTVLAGIRLVQGRSRGLVWLGIGAAVGVPVAGLALNGLSGVNLTLMGSGCYGCLLGNVPTLVLLLVDLPLGCVAAYALRHR